MKNLKFLFLSLTFILSVCGVFAQQTKWSLDETHAKLGFSITHLSISDVEGSFKKFNVSVLSDKADFTDAVIELEADIKSINTDNTMRDEHLQGDDYFSAAKFPKLTFKSTSFKHVNGKAYSLEGDLTLKGITKKVTLDVTFNGSTVHPYSKKTVAGFKVKGKINRVDFNIASGTPSAMLGTDIELTANLEIVK